MSHDLQFMRDVLLQMQEEQTNQGQTLARLEGNLDVRVKKLETAQKMNWWTTYVVAPLVGIAHGVCAHYGIKI